MPQLQSTVGSRYVHIACVVIFSSLGVVFSSIRYCNFYGKYFCTNCHNNDSVVVPAFVVQKWDFTAFVVLCALKVYLTMLIGTRYPFVPYSSWRSSLMSHCTI